MDQQVRQQLDQTLRSQWQMVSQEILQRFPTVSRSDIDTARDADDLVRRISDKSHYSERLVETQLNELALSGGGSSQQQFGQQFPQGQQQQQYTPQSQQQSFGSGQ